MPSPSEMPVSQETEKEPQPLGFSWLTRNNEDQRKEGINLTPKQEEAYAYVVYATPLPEELTQTEREKLTSYVAADGKEYFYCGYGKFDLDRACKMEPNKLPSLTHHNQRLRGNEMVTPLSISEQEVADVIKGGKVLIYTGAGISVAAGTPDMKGLIAYLGIDRSKRVDEFAQMVMFSPEAMHRRLMELQESFFERPTPAHTALTKIQEVTGARIATENLDMLGEAAGQELIKRGDIDKKFPDEELTGIECIITVGLRADDSGLLYRYKQINPNGRFIALNIEPPPYLDEKDYYLEGDAQVTVPHIAELISK
jgi:hypothetical protein